MLSNCRWPTPTPPHYNVVAQIWSSKGHVCTAKILQVLFGASLVFNFVFGGEGVRQDLLSNMFSDNAASNCEVFYLQCFRQPSEFRISSLHMWLSVRIFWLESIRRCRTSRSELFWLKVQDGELESIRRCRCIAACRGVSCFVRRESSNRSGDAAALPHVEE